LLEVYERRILFASKKSSAGTAVRCMLEVYKELVANIKKLDKEIKNQCASTEKLLMTIPGVGPVTALTFTSEIGKPGRFKRSRKVGAYLGMTPKQYSSGETTKMGRISKTGPTTLRSLLVEAGMVILTRTHSWSKLKAWEQKLKKTWNKKSSCCCRQGIRSHNALHDGNRQTIPVYSQQTR